MEALDMPYLQSTRRAMFTKRGKWLALLLVGEMLTTIPLGFFEDKLHQVTVLALFLPLIVSGGGNSGSQASTLVIRAMALGEVRTADWWLVLRRELFMGTALGILLGGIAAVRVLVWGAAGAYHGAAGEHYAMVGITVAVAVTGCVTWGTLSGAMLPFLLKKTGADPASASAPLVATIVDVSGIAIYLTVATLVLSGTLL
jgi:magnesium transporter